MRNASKVYGRCQMYVQFTIFRKCAQPPLNIAANAPSVSSAISFQAILDKKVINNLKRNNMQTTNSMDFASLVQLLIF